MTSKERVIAAFESREYDRIPLVNPTSLANIDCMRIAKAYYPYVHTNFVQMAALAATGHTVLKFDSVMPYFGVLNEVASFGVDIDWGEITRPPTVCSAPQRTMEHFEIPSNYLDRKPIRTVIRAVRELKQQFQNSVAIFGKIVGPLSILFYLYGVQNSLTSLILEPQTVLSILNEMKNLCIEFARAQIEAGADVITISEDAAGALISRNCYKNMVMDIEKAINQAIQKDAYTIFHLSCDITDRIDLFAESGFSALSFDSRNNFVSIRQKHMDMKLIGCINNPVTLLNGSRTDIFGEVFSSIQRGMDMIGPECSIPLRVTNTNLLAIYDAVVRYSGSCKPPSTST